MTIELDNIGQDHKATSKPGTNTVYFLDHNAIKNIPADRENTYSHIVVDSGLQTTKIWSK